MRSKEIARNSVVIFFPSIPPCRILKQSPAFSWRAGYFGPSWAGRIVNQDCWLLEYPWQLEKNKDWSGGVLEKNKNWSVGVVEYWSVGLKSGNRSDFYSFTFGYARSKHGLYFSIINHSSLRYSSTPGTINLLSLAKMKSELF